ncbi:MAG: nicotinate-nucleotide--dimethylbenzimidazole phosphoribosyltransferase [Lachnospiraceae bacterium]|nr:nicotinate-nucleotide--dimethylbenzimidazole phosphoribosyltransferase [Lachnospiraceae bacterium]
MKNNRWVVDDILNQKISVDQLNPKDLENMNNEWNHVSKPLGSFGKFEKVYSRIAVIQKQDVADLSHMKLVVFCGDHGIVEEGVSQTGQEVTGICAQNIGRGLTTAGVMANSLGVEICAVDVGIHSDSDIPHTKNCRIKKGTNNFLKEPAMTVPELKAAIQVGMDEALESKENGIRCLLVGEMGIGNTTSAAVMAGYFLGLDAHTVTGRGAGIDDGAFQRKQQVVETALSMYQNLSTLEICSYFGGLELAAMTGLILGGALYGVPVILDGMLSMISALSAERLLEHTKDYVIASHMSKEPVAKSLAKELSLQPVIYGNMAVGEGAGALMLLPQLRLTDVVFREALKFGDSGVDQYKNYEEEK